MKKIVVLATLAALSTGSTAAGLDPSCDEYERKLKALSEQLPEAQAAQIRDIHKAIVETLAKRSKTEQAEICKNGIKMLDENGHDDDEDDDSEDEDE